jgi:hypothetical protein
MGLRERPLRFYPKKGMDPNGRVSGRIRAAFEAPSMPEGKRVLECGELARPLAGSSLLFFGPACRAVHALRFGGGLALSEAAAQPGCPIPTRREQAPGENKAGASSRTPKCRNAQASVQSMGDCFGTWREIPNEERGTSFRSPWVTLTGSRETVPSSFRDLAISRCPLSHQESRPVPRRYGAAFDVGLLRPSRKRVEPQPTGLA